MTRFHAALLAAMLAVPAVARAQPSAVPIEIPRPVAPAAARRSGPPRAGIRPAPGQRPRGRARPCRKAARGKAKWRGPKAAPCRLLARV